MSLGVVGVLLNSLVAKNQASPKTIRMAIMGPTSLKGDFFIFGSFSFGGGSLDSLAFTGCWLGVFLGGEVLGIGLGCGGATTGLVVGVGATAGTTGVMGVCGDMGGLEDMGWLGILGVDGVLRGGGGVMDPLSPLDGF